MSSVQASLSRGKAAAAAGIRYFSSDPPQENISRYPVPYKKDLPFDIVALMEEVESKVQLNKPL